jgi:hypothetical protein
MLVSKQLQGLSGMMFRVKYRPINNAKWTNNVLVTVLTSLPLILIDFGAGTASIDIFKWTSIGSHHMTYFTSHF